MPTDHETYEHDSCGGTLRESQYAWNMNGVMISGNGYRCDRCGDEFMDTRQPAAASLVPATANEKGEGRSGEMP